MTPPLQALFFDVFGTLVDWRTSIAREAEASLAPLGFHLDWLAFADAWRGEYQPAMEEIRSGRQPFCDRGLATPVEFLLIGQLLRSGYRFHDVVIHHSQVLLQVVVVRVVPDIGPERLDPL